MDIVANLDGAITRFAGPYAFLSNFYMADFTYHGIAKLNGIIRLVSPIIQFISNRQYQKNAENLKRILESNQP